MLSSVGVDEYLKRLDSPTPSALVIGSSHAGTDAVGDLLGAQPSVCAGALRVFDDAIRYMGGLPAPIGRHVSKARRQRGANTTCATFVATPSYLPSRWAPARLRASLWARRNELRFGVVLRNPTERAVRHWRSLTYFVAHGLGVHGGRQAGKAAGKAVEIASKRAAARRGASVSASARKVRFA